MNENICHRTYGCANAPTDWAHWRNSPPTQAVALAPAWTRADFQAAVSYWAQRLQAARVAHAAVWCGDAAWLAVALLACNRAGVTACLPGRANAADTEYFHPQTVWLCDSDEAGTETPARWRIDRLPEQAGIVPPTFDWLIRPDVRIVLQTSGSTGAPKNIVKTWADMLLEAQVLASLPWPSAGAPVWGSVSPQHLYGLTFRVMLPLVSGRPMVRRRAVYPEDALSSGCLNGIGVVSPTWLRAWVDSGADKTAQRQTQFVCAGGALLPETANALEGQGFVPVREIYGSTETGVMAVRDGTQPWRFLPPVRHRTDADGRLYVQSPWSGGEQATGDLIRADGGGFALLGRCDRIVKMAEKRVSLGAVEQILLRHEWVADAVCAAHPQRPRLGAWTALNAAGVAAYRNQGRKAVVAALRRYVAQSAESAAVPRYWRFALSLPRNAQGKLPHGVADVLWQPRPRSVVWEKLSETENNWHLRASVPLDLAYFSGHFDVFPLVPGVIELQWVMDAWNMLRQMPPPVCVENLKFRHFLRPADEMFLHLRWLPEKHKMTFSLQTADAVCAEGRAVFAGETP